MTNKQYDLDEVRAKCGYLNETYAVCAAYGTEGQRAEAAIGFADYLAEVLPVIFGAYDRMNDFEKSQCAKLLEKISQLEVERDAARREICYACEALATATGHGWEDGCDECQWRGLEAPNEQS